MVIRCDKRNLMIYSETFFAKTKMVLSLVSVCIDISISNLTLLLSSSIQSSIRNISPTVIRDNCKLFYIQDYVRVCLQIYEIQIDCLSRTDALRQHRHPFDRARGKVYSSSRVKLRLIGTTLMGVQQSMFSEHPRSYAPRAGIHFSFVSAIHSCSWEYAG